MSHTSLMARDGPGQGIARCAMRRLARRAEPSPVSSILRPPALQVHAARPLSSCRKWSPWSRAGADLDPADTALKDVVCALNLAVGAQLAGLGEGKATGARGGERSRAGGRLGGRPRASPDELTDVVHELVVRRRGGPGRALQIGHDSGQREIGARGRRARILPAFPAGGAPARGPRRTPAGRGRTRRGRTGRTRRGRGRTRRGGAGRWRRARARARPAGSVRAPISDVGSELPGAAGGEQAS